jgi:hypothetical protein
MLEDYFEEEEEEEQEQEHEEQQQQPASAEVAVTKMAKEIKPTALPSVFFSRPKKGHSAPVVMWACAWCLVSWNITQK